MKSNTGFTLLEVVFTLTVWTIIISVTVPLTMTSLNAHNEKEFFKTLMSDVLLIQTMSHGVSKNDNSITFKETNYVIELNAKYDLYREYPRGWKLDERTFKKVSFNNGTIRKAGTILFVSDEANYRLVFPFGKGGGYIEKQ